MCSFSQLFSNPRFDDKGAGRREAPRILFFFSREEEQRLEDGLAALNARKRQMEDALQAYTLSRREASLGGDGPTRPNRSAEKKVDAAEQAFDRAMAGAGGVGLARADAETINRVAEIDGMQKSATVAERLAALKAQQAA